MMQSVKDSSQICGNCMRVASFGDEFPRCEDFLQVRFCSPFCATYAMQKGTHRKQCSGADRRYCFFNFVDHEDMEHPAKCILCLLQLRRGWNCYSCSGEDHRGRSMHLQGLLLYLSRMPPAHEWQERFRGDQVSLLQS